MNEPENTTECPVCEGRGYTDAPGTPTCFQCTGYGRVLGYTPRSADQVMQGPLSTDADFQAKAEDWLQRCAKGLLTVPELVEIELEGAKRKFPDWPTDPMHAVGILGEEYGEVVKDCLQLTYEPSKTNLENLRKETIQLAAMCHRFLESLDRYEFKASAQHKQ